MHRFLPVAKLMPVLALTATIVTHAAHAEGVRQPPTMTQVLAASTPADWRVPAPENTLYLDLASGRVVIELAPAFAPAHVDNIRRLARERYWDGLAIVRSQDNYVVQWGDPHADDADLARALGTAKAHLPAEFDRPAAELAFTPLADGDVYAPQVGWSNGFPAARDPADGRAWLGHCYGAVGAGRGNAADSSNGTSLYAVTGHAPRHLDRNITVVGRVLQGIEHVSTLPRGTGALGFYEDPAQRVAIISARLASELPESERTALEVLRTDTDTFQRLVESRRNRHDEWFIDPVGRIELCNVPISVRARSSSPTLEAKDD